MVYLNYSLDLLCDIRMHAAEILDSGVIDHTEETLQLMRAAYGENDPEIEQIDLIATKIRGTRKHRPRLHAEILASALAILRLSQAKVIMDIGCGEGLLVRALAQEKMVNKVIGIDTDSRQIKAAHSLMKSVHSHAKADFYLSDESLINDTAIDAITILEVIEHVADQNWIDTIFTTYNPSLLIVTTPNKRFNVLYNQRHIGLNGFRHPDHAFEFTDSEFLDWSKEHAAKHSYTVHLLQIGPADIEHGSSGMLALFQKS